MTTPQLLPLSGKRAVVTGASRGIGRGIALALATAGADVAVSARTKAELDELAAQIRAIGRQAITVQCDVTNQRQVQTDLAGGVLGAWRGIDILVNNAGASGSAKFLGHDDELWHRMLEINLTSVYYVTKAFVPAMVAQRSGRIITIASIAARTGAKYIAAYAASKHGVLGLMRALAVELNPYNITVNCVCPGYVDTPMTDRSIANVAAKTGMGEQQARATLEKMSPQGRLVQPEEVARIAVFLADPASASITGQAINVDGGSVMS
jgi:NAD(P)-dependent dehydrogenase (short-subunit alcohol dehydrogenase family)